MKSKEQDDFTELLQKKGRKEESQRIKNMSRKQKTMPNKKKV